MPIDDEPQAQGPEGRGPETQGPSFDPRTWREGAAAAERTAAPAKSPEPARRGLLLAGGGLLALGVAAGAGVLLARRKPPAPSPSHSPFRQRAGVPADAERRRLALGQGETARTALHALGVRPVDLAEVERLSPGLAGPAGAELTAARRPDGLLLLTLRVQAPDGRVLAFERQDETAPLLLSKAAAKIQARPVVVHGEVGEAGLYASAVRAGMNDAVVPRFARALAFDLDFAREVATGDAFEAVYEETPDGVRNLVFAGFRHAARQGAGGQADRAIVVERYAFAPQDGEPDWYDARGGGARRALMRTPLDGARVTSVFGPRRHPVLGYTRAHQGVDFGAGVGTPVFASGDGIVEFAGVARGYGNYLKIRHGPHLVTAYAHLDAFDAGVVPGAAVRQGEIVARSGQTGVGTGPHLHYEVIVDGAHTDPLTALLSLGEGPSEQLKARDLELFRAARDRIDVLRTSAL
jgi:murein DD-endopeptidase MepM/ murein hydrolase activator NlpD